MPRVSVNSAFPELVGHGVVEHRSTDTDYTPFSTRRRLTSTGSNSGQVISACSTSSLTKVGT